MTHASRRSQAVAEKEVALAGGGRAGVNPDPQTQTSSTFEPLLHPLVSCSLPVEQRRAPTVRCGCALPRALGRRLIFAAEEEIDAGDFSGIVSAACG